MIRLIAFLTSLTLLVACGETQLDEAPEDLGTFKMRVGYIYTDKALQWPLSRNAEGSDWNATLQNSLDGRLRRYEGTQEYDVAITLEGFMLAPPGIPIVLSPKSVAVVNVFVYDVAGQEYLAKKHQMEIFESTTGESAVLGSGHSRSKDEQIAGLSLNIVDAVEEWMAKQHQENGWFDLRTDDVEIDPAAPS